MASELRIGNWIDTKEFHIPALKGNHKYEGKWYKYTFMFDPIPLTEEWLLKFGFSIKGFKGGYQICTSSLGGWILDNGFSCVGIEFEYVHQLQNLYFALTNEELKIKE